MRYDNQGQRGGSDMEASKLQGEKSSESLFYNKCRGSGHVFKDCRLGWFEDRRVMQRH
jgi:hypothetical protein